MRLAAAVFRQALPDWHSEVDQLIVRQLPPGMLPSFDVHVHQLGRGGALVAADPPAAGAVQVRQRRASGDGASGQEVE
jgi:hypothetical protein